MFWPFGVFFFHPHPRYCRYPTDGRTEQELDVAVPADGRGRRPRHSRHPRAARVPQDQDQRDEAGAGEESFTYRYERYVTLFHKTNTPALENEIRF